jgi:hypothetical protein
VRKQLGRQAGLAYWVADGSIKASRHDDDVWSELQRLRSTQAMAGVAAK